MTLYEHRTLLGSIKSEVKVTELKELERLIAFEFLVKSGDNLLTAKEIEGIVYFLGVNLIKLSSYFGIDRSTLTNIIKGKKPSKMLCHMLLEAVEKELLFPNYFKAKFESAIECKLDKYFYERLITKKAA
jgi:hypothetical protein